MPPFPTRAHALVLLFALASCAYPNMYAMETPPSSTAIQDLLVELVHRTSPPQERLSFYGLYLGMSAQAFEFAWELPANWRDRCERNTTAGAPSEMSCYFYASGTGLGRRIGVPFSALRFLVSFGPGETHIVGIVATRVDRALDRAWNEYQFNAARWLKTEPRLVAYRRAPATSLANACSGPTGLFIEESDIRASLTFSCIEDEFQVMATLH